MNKLIVIVGPTAIGKTSFSIQLAQKLHTEIISADSRQFYKELKIGSAVPNEKELKLVPHHFIHFLSVKQPYSAGKYEVDAINSINKLFEKHDYLILTGGSGLYIHAVCHGFDHLPGADSEIRGQMHKLLSEKGISALQKKLSKMDPECFQQTDINNPHRLIRAIEVCMVSKTSYSNLRKKQAKKRNFEVIKVGLELPREKLYQRINDRVDKMLKSGLADEAKLLFKYRKLQALQTVGYQELFKYFDGEIDLETASDLIKRNTRRYAKRQLTWFKRDSSIKWISPKDKNVLLA